MILDQLPALQIVILLLTAPLCLLLPRPALAWFAALTGTLVAAVISALLLWQVTTIGPIDYNLGGWQAPWGIAFRIDALSAFILVLVSWMGAIVLACGRCNIAGEIPRERLGAFYALYVLTLTGLLGMTITGDAFNVFVFLEISSLSSYVLIAIGRDKRALRAAFRYLVMGTLGGTFFLIGVVLLYVMTGTLNMADLAARLPAVADSRTVHTAVAFIVIGLGIKLAMFPLHTWLPNAYAHAPSVVSTLLAATATKVSLYVLVRFLFDIFGIELITEKLPLTAILGALGAAAILGMSAVALFQDNLKKLLAYSSVSQVGYMLIGLSLASEAGLTAGLTHLFNHALAKALLFMALGAVLLRLGTVNLSELRGLGQTMPWTMAAFVIGGLSLVGVPLTAGFVSKWTLINAAVAAGWWPLVIVILLGSLLAAAYLLRIVEVAYFNQPARLAHQDSSPCLMLPLWILVIANLYFGLDTELTLGSAQRAAAMLLGAGA